MTQNATIALDLILGDVRRRKRMNKRALYLKMSFTSGKKVLTRYYHYYDTGILHKLRDMGFEIVEEPVFVKGGIFGRKVLDQGTSVYIKW